MATDRHWDVIIIGGSYSGLSAAMALGRSLRKVCVVDSGLPCNRQTPHSHNFITHDGNRPADIAAKAREEVLKYDTVQMMSDTVTEAWPTNQGFEITTASGKLLTAIKILFATGVKDLMPDMPGIADCWGISVIHCPYCHGYEVRNKVTGIMGNGPVLFDFAKLVYNLTKNLTLFTNGPSELTSEQHQKLQESCIKIIEKPISAVIHENGQIIKLEFTDGDNQAVEALYARLPFEQHSAIPARLGCELTEMGHLKVDAFQRTNIKGVYACGDNTTPMRSVAAAVASGNMAGAAINKELTEE